MRGDKTVARILLIFSIANVMLAAPVVVRQRRSVTDNPDDESMDWSPHDMPLYASQLSHQDSVSGSPPGSFRQDLAPVSVARQPRDDQPSGSGAQHQPMLDPLLDNLPPPSGATQSHDNPPSGSGTGSLHDDSTPWWQNSNSITEIEEVGSPPHSGVGAWGNLGSSSSLASALAAIEAYEAKEAKDSEAAKQPEATGLTRLRQKVIKGLCSVAGLCAGLLPVDGAEKEKTGTVYRIPGGDTYAGDLDGIYHGRPFYPRHRKKSGLVWSR